MNLRRPTSRRPSTDDAPKQTVCLPTSTTGLLKDMFGEHNDEMITHGMFANVPQDDIQKTALVFPQNKLVFDLISNPAQMRTYVKGYIRQEQTWEESIFYL